jgi:hypothetical protein
MVQRRGYCHTCAQWHSFEITGVVRATGIALGLAAAASARHPLPILVSLASAIIGDAIEARLASRCPACAVALDLALGFMGRS